MKKDEHRLLRIESLLTQRDSHVNPNTKEINYTLYDEPIHALNDEGHIDWMFAQLKSRNKKEELSMQNTIQQLLKIHSKDEILKALNHLKQAI